MKVVNWNVNWATPRSKRSPEILNRINEHAPEIVCLTETHAGLLQGGHAICAGPDHGYGIQKIRRKVLLWSRESWERVDDIAGMPDCRRDDLSPASPALPWVS